MVLGIGHPSPPGSVHRPPSTATWLGYSRRTGVGTKVLSWRAGMGCRPHAHNCTLWLRGLRIVLTAQMQDTKTSGGRALRWLPALVDGAGVGCAVKRTKEGTREEHPPNVRTLGRYHFQRPCPQAPSYLWADITGFPAARRLLLLHHIRW